MKGMTKVKIAVSLPEEQVVSAKQAVADGHARSVSGYVSEALRQYDQRGELTRYLDELDERYGPPGPDAEAWADDAMRKVQRLRSQGGYPSR